MKILELFTLLPLTCIVTLSCSDENSSPEIKIEAHFTADKTTIIAGETIQFTDASTSEPTSWEWTFEGGTPKTSNEQNPKISYLTAGNFDVSLKISSSKDDTETSVINFISVQSRTAPPHDGTIFIEKNILTKDDPSTYQEIVYKGTALRTMYDRRVNDWIEVEAHLFEITFEKKLVEAQVNAEFTGEEALYLSTKYAQIIGRIPNVLLKDIETLWIHDGVNPFGGGNNSLLIHVGQANVYENDGILEEVFIHEACHTSLDMEHANSPDWIAAQNNDPIFISTYARDNPASEDIAESFLPYLAIKFKSDRISDDMRNIIIASIPNRIQYFENQDFDYSPFGN